MKNTYHPLVVFCVQRCDVNTPRESTFGCIHNNLWVVDFRKLNWVLPCFATILRAIQIQRPAIDSQNGKVGSTVRAERHLRIGSAESNLLWKGAVRPSVSP